MRINKFLSQIGYCSRREADRLLDAGKIYIGERKARKGDILQQEEKIYIDGKYIGSLGDEERVEDIILLVHKPRGIVCTTSDKDRAKNIIEYLSYPQRIYPIGRLDKDSEGLLLMTNRGDLVNAIMKSVNLHEKEYEVEVDKPIADAFIKSMAGGVYLHELGVRTRKASVQQMGERTFRIILTQGLNRQIRRMCQGLGYEVKRLKRVRIMNLCLSGIEYGAYRSISTAEKKELERLLWQGK